MTGKKAGKKAHSTVSIATPAENSAAGCKPLSETAVLEAHRPSENDHVAASKLERIALLAYKYWLERGCQGGSPEEDWFRAEREINLASST